MFLILSQFAKAEVIPVGNVGQDLYIQKCIACHNRDPQKAGVTGPDLYTTPYRVFQSKVITGMYPVDYTPKRTSNRMPKFKFLLTIDVELIYNYIRSTRK